MKVRLLTYHFSDNYGALLQAYALRESLRRKGIDTEFINYHPSYVEEGGCFDETTNLRKLKKNLTIAYLKVSHVYWSLFGSRSQRRAFDEFRLNYLGVTGQRLFDAADLAGTAAPDLLVCGSDQIWNPSIQKGLDPVYFLSFPGANQSRRISYAPSFGKSFLAEEYHGTAGALLGELDAISVREVSGMEIVKDASGRECICVPDPTILLGDFSDLLRLKNCSRDKYVFCYALRTAEVIRGVAEYVAQISGAALLSPRSTRQRWKSIGEGVEPGPVEWLQLINGATKVVTNSFHGVALSIVLNRSFLAVALPGKKDMMNERVLNLLEHTGLMDRIVRTVNKSEIDSALGKPIDWEDVNRKLAELRRVGNAFLLDQLAQCKPLGEIDA